MLFLAISLLVSSVVFGQRNDDLYKSNRKLEVNKQRINPGTLLVKSAEQRNMAIIATVMAIGAGLTPLIDANVPKVIPRYVAPVLGIFALSFTISANINQHKAGEMLSLEYK